jgi:hypothetical protein
MADLSNKQISFRSAVRLLYDVPQAREVLNQAFKKLSYTT